MLLSPRKNGLTSLFKEVRVFKVAKAAFDTLQVFTGGPCRKGVRVPIYWRPWKRGLGLGSGGWWGGVAFLWSTECTKIARFSAAVAAIFTAPQEIARCLEAPRCAISSAKKIASEPRFFLRRKWVNIVLAAEFLAIPSSAVKIVSERWQIA